MADYYICPGCGKEVRVGSAGCPDCNNLDPWEIDENEAYDGLDLPDDEFDYEEFVEKEFNHDKIPTLADPKRFFWWIVAVILLLAFVFVWVLGF